MVKKTPIITGLFLLFLTLFTPLSFADSDGVGGEPSQSDTPVQASSMKSLCSNIPDGYPECADSPAECGSKGNIVNKTGDAEGDSEYGVAGTLVEYNTPINCLFLNEPIGGRTGYDLYKISADGNHQLWYGEVLVGQEYGPYQAILTYEEGKETQGPFGLLYNYLGLVYNFLSGIIIAAVILIVIVGGIVMTTSAGNTEGFGRGKSMIIKALIGMVLWFVASVVLYTINPTFFAF